MEEESNIIGEKIATNERSKGKGKTADSWKIWVLQDTSQRKKRISFIIFPVL